MFSRYKDMVAILALQKYSLNKLSLHLHIAAIGDVVLLNIIENGKRTIDSRLVYLKLTCECIRLISAT